MKRATELLNEDIVIRKMYKSKKELRNFNYEKFRDWYVQQNAECCYCGLTAIQSKVLFEKFPKSTRGGRRGKSLEIDRKIAHYGYSHSLDNLVLACYWCNNAKTNYFSFDEFKILGPYILNVQLERLRCIPNQ